MNYGITKEELSPSLLSFIENCSGNNGSGQVQTIIRKNTVVVKGNRTTVNIGIKEFNKSTDLLMVMKNSVYIEETLDYTLSADNSTIIKVGGDVWDERDIEVTFNFIVFSLGEDITNFKKNTIVINSTIDKVNMGIDYVSGDSLMVFMNSTYLELGSDYTISADGIYILPVATSSWEVDIDDELIFNFVNIKNSSSNSKLIELENNLKDITQKQKVSITDFGAVGDGITNDYQAFINACNSVGVNGVLYFPKTVENKYFLHNGLSGTAMRIKMEGKPIFEFENPNTILKYEYDPDLKFLRTRTPFILNNHWETITRKIDTTFIEDKIQKVGSQKKNPNQKLSKLSFLTDFGLENYNGNSWVSNTTNTVTENELTFIGGSGYCLATKSINISEYIEMLFVRNSTIATTGHYDLTITTNIGTYAIQFNAVAKAISVGKFVGGNYSEIIASLTIQDQCFLKDNGSILFGINRVSQYAFDFIANGVFIYRLIIDGNENVSKCGFGHTSSNNINTTMKSPISSQNYINMNYQTRNLFSFGDSITFGAYSFKDYPKMISDMLYQEKGFKKLNVFNYGVSGDNSTQCLTRINAHLGEISGKDIVTIQIGTNDCQNKQALDLFKTNLISIVDRLKLNTTLILIASFILYDKSIANYENIGAYNSVIKQVCIEKGVTFVDNNSNFGINNGLLPDKIHPDEEGDLILAKGFADGIYNLINP